MKLFENYNRAKQVFGNNIAQEAMNNGLPNQYIYIACRFHFENNVPFQNLKSLFKQWTTYVGNKASIDINSLNYETFIQILEKCKKDTLSVGEIYNDDVVSVRRITNYEEMKQLPFANFWCVRKLKKWNEYKKKVPPAEFLLVTNKHFSEDSNCMYVMIEMYSNGDIGYWSTDNELIDEMGSTGRLPKLNDYKKTLGAALNVIEQERTNITNNKQNLKCNRKMKKNQIRLTESQLHRVIKESVKKVLNERNLLARHINGDNIDDSFEKLVNSCIEKISTRPNGHNEGKYTTEDGMVSFIGSQGVQTMRADDYLIKKFNNWVQKNCAQLDENEIGHLTSEFSPNYGIFVSGDYGYALKFSDALATAL